MPRDFSLVLCDGPPASTVGGRSGTLPRLHPHLGDEYVVLIDDAHRDGERACAREGQAVTGGQLLERGTDRPFFELRVPAP